MLAARWREAPPGASLVTVEPLISRFRPSALVRGGIVAAWNEQHESVDPSRQQERIGQSRNESPTKPVAAFVAARAPDISVKNTGGFSLAARGSGLRSGLTLYIKGHREFAAMPHSIESAGLAALRS
jgi:hypothetical protein